MAASVCSGEVSQSADGSVLTFTDTGSYNPPVTSRVLAIFNYNLNLLATIDMGSSLTATYPITADGWFQFVLIVTDSTGTFTCTVNFLASAFYQNTFANAIATLPGAADDIFGTLFNLNLSQDNYQAALRMFIGGFSVASQNLITQANFYAQTPYYVV